MLSALRNFALTFVIAALIFGIIAYVIVGFVLDTMSDTIPTGDDRPTIGTSNNDTDDSPQSTDSSSPNTDTTAPDNSDDTAPVEDDEIIGDTFNMLLVGSDYQPEIFDDYDYEQKWQGPGFPDRRNRKWGADMIVLLRVDKENRQFIFCPIPRNTRVLVDGNYMQLGDVLSEKGIDFLCGKISGLTGFNIDYHVLADVGSIPAAVDAIGTVTYYVPEDMIYSDPLQQLEINLKKGTTTINGERAEQLLRYVGYSNGNVGRMNTTVELCKAVLAKFTNVTYLDKADDLYNAVKDHVTTNFTVDDLLNNLDLIFSYSKFESLTVTYPGSNKVHDGVNYFEPSLTSALDMFDSYK